MNFCLPLPCVCLPVALPPLRGSAPSPCAPFEHSSFSSRGCPPPPVHHARRFPGAAPRSAPASFPLSTPTPSPSPLRLPLALTAGCRCPAAGSPSPSPSRLAVGLPSTPTAAGLSSTTPVSPLVHAGFFAPAYDAQPWPRTSPPHSMPLRPAADARPPAHPLSLVPLPPLRPRPHALPRAHPPLNHDSIV